MKNLGLLPHLCKGHLQIYMTLRFPLCKSSQAEKTMI